MIVCTYFFLSCQRLNFWAWWNKQKLRFIGLVHYCHVRNISLSRIKLKRYVWSVLLGYQIEVPRNFKIILKLLYIHIFNFCLKIYFSLCFFDTFGSCVIFWSKVTYHPYKQSWFRASWVLKQRLVWFKLLNQGLYGTHLNKFSFNRISKTLIDNTLLVLIFIPGKHF